MENKTPMTNVMKQLEGLTYEEAISVLSMAQCTVTKNAIKSEIDKSQIKMAKATCQCYPGLWKVLQEKFPDLKSYEADS